MKEKYLKPESDISKFTFVSVVTTSDTDGPIELPDIEL